MKEFNSLAEEEAGDLPNFDEPFLLIGILLAAPAPDVVVAVVVVGGYR